jgi:hypothetical protein
MEDVLADERGNYINMMRRFLWDGVDVNLVEVSSPRLVTGDGEWLQKRLSDFLLFCKNSGINRRPGTSKISNTGHRLGTVEIDDESLLLSRYRGSERMAHWFQRSLDRSFLTEVHCDCII